MTLPRNHGRCRIGSSTSVRTYMTANATLKVNLKPHPMKTPKVIAYKNAGKKAITAIMSRLYTILSANSRISLFLLLSIYLLKRRSHAYNLIILMLLRHSAITLTLAPCLSMYCFCTLASSFDR